MEPGGKKGRGVERLFFAAKVFRAKTVKIFKRENRTNKVLMTLLNKLGEQPR